MKPVSMNFPWYRACGREGTPGHRGPWDKTMLHPGAATRQKGFIQGFLSCGTCSWLAHMEGKGGLPQQHFPGQVGCSPSPSPPQIPLHLPLPSQLY